MPAVNSALYLSRLKYSTPLPSTGPNAGVPVIQPSFTTLPTGQIVPVVSNVPVAAAVTVPNAPTLVYVAGSDTQTFSPSSGATSYNLFAIDGTLLKSLGSSTSFTLSSLPNANSSYTAYVTASNSGGTSVPSNSITFSTNATAPTISLSGPNLNVTSTNTGSITYKLYGVGGSSSTISSGNTPLSSIGLTPGTVYTVSATATGLSGFESLRSSTVQICIPIAPTTITAGTPTTTGASISWTAPAGGVTGYNIYNGNGFLGTTTGTTFSASGLNPSTSHSLTVKSYYNSTTNESTTAGSVSFNTVPTDPTNASGTLNLSDFTSGTLNWSLPASPSGTPTGYIISKAGVVVATVTGLTYNVTGLDLGVTNTFTIRSYYNTTTNISSPGAIATVLTPPGPPTSLTAPTKTTTSATLTWTPPTGGVTGYNIYNGVTKLANTTSTSFTVSGLNPSTSYTLSVKSYLTSATNESTPANVTFDTVPTDPTNASGSLNLLNPTSGTLNWNVPASPSGTPTGYIISRAGTVVATVSALSYAVTGLTLGATNTFTIRSYFNAINNVSTPGATATFLTPPNPPVSLSSLTPTTTGATLTWTAPSGNSTGYNIYNGPTMLGTTTGTTFSASGLNPSTSYTLSVKTYLTSSTNESTAATVTFDTVPTDPTNASGTLNVSDPTTGTLNWSPPASPSGTPSGYIISKNFMVVATVTGLTYNVTGLTLGVTNSFLIKSYYNSISNLSTPGVTATLLTPPSPPTSLTAPTKTTTGAILTWTAAVGNSTGYNIYNGSTRLGTTTSTSFTVSGLNPSTSYTLSVKTYLNTTTNESTAANVTFDTVPTDPTNASGSLSLVDPTSGTLNWNLPASPSGTPTGYIVYKAGVEVATVSALSYAVTGLTLGATNTFTIRSYFSSTSNISTPGATATFLTPPNPPTSLTVPSTTTTGGVLTWTSSVGSVTGYNIYNSSALIGTTLTTSFNVSSLTNATTYTLSVKAYLTSTTNESTPVNVTFDTVPLDPTNLTVTQPTTTSLQIGWNNAPNATGYTIYNGPTVLGSVVGTTSYNATGLNPATTYSIRVRTYYRTTTNLSAPGAQISGLTLPNTPGSVTASSLTTTGASLAWVASTGGADGYNIYNGSVRLGTSTTTAFTVSTLNPSTAYTLSVRAYYGPTTNESTTGSTVTFNTVPTDPTNATAVLSLVDPTTGILNWFAPASPSGTPTGYIISRAGTEVATVSALTYNVVGLTLGVANTFTIRSYFSSTSNISTPGATATFTPPPAPPVSLTISSMPSTTGTLNWTAPAGGSTGYNVYNGSTLLGSTVSLSFPLTGLVNATTYTLSVKTYLNTTNNESTPSNITFDTIPLDPTGLTVSQPTNSSVQIGWNNALNATGYTIYNGSTVLGTVVGATSYTATGLNAATSYTFRVRTYFRNSTNLSTPGAQINGSTLPNPPLTLQATNVMQTTATLTWTAPAGNVSSYRVYDSGNNLLATTSSTSYNLGTPNPLTLGTSYTFGVSSFNTPTSTESTRATVTFSTLASLNPPTNLSVPITNNNNVALSWVAPVGPHDGYVIVQSGYASNTYNYADSRDTPDPYTVTGLVPGQAYTFNIFTYAGQTTNRSTTSASVSLITRPSPPSGLASSETTGLRTLLTWNHATTPTGVNGLVYKYNVYYGTNFLGSVAASTSPLSYVVTGLIRNSTYVFNLTAVAKSATIPDIETIATGTVSLATVTVTTPVNWSQILYQPTSNIYTWKGVAMSTGADRIYVIADNAPYFSLDYGATWNIDSAIVNAGGSYFSGISMASDGLKVAIACQNGGVYVCNDITQGVKTWIQIQNLSGAPTFWRSVALSGDGTKLYAGLCDQSQTNYDSVCYSSYNGSSWAPFQRLGPNTSANKARWVDLACSNNGSVVYAATGQGTFFYKFTIGVSTNWGQFQSSQVGQQYTVTSVCCNSDGTRAYYATQNAGLYYMYGTSSQVDRFGDFGGIRLFTSVRCTPDGQGVVAVDKGNGGNVLRWDNGTGGNGTLLLTNASLSGSDASVACNAANTRFIVTPPMVGANDPNLQTRKIWIGDYN
jgi:hypothetical protein